MIVKWITGPVLCAGIAVAASTAWADETTSEIEDLRKRVAELEAVLDTPNRPKLSFNTGPRTTLELYGFVRAEAFYDLDTVNPDLFVATRAGEPAFATDGAFDTSVRVSRLGLRSVTETDIGTIRGQLEYDLFGSNGTAELRLRHANVRIGENWLIGQFWTNFMPLVHYPTTVDFNGPVGISFARVPQVRYTGTSGDLEYSFSVEQNQGNSSDPLFTAAAFYQGDRWSARIAGLTSRVDSGGSSFDTNGVTVSAGFQPWQGATISGTYVTGEGIGSILIGGGADVVGGTVNDVDGFTLAYQQKVGEKWTFGVALGDESYDLPTSTGTLDFTDLQTVHVSAFYEPVDNLVLGLEYITGERTTSTGQSFDADRIGASITFSF